MGVGSLDGAVGDLRPHRTSRTRPHPHTVKVVGSNPISLTVFSFPFIPPKRLIRKAASNVGRAGAARFFIARMFVALYQAEPPQFVFRLWASEWAYMNSSWIGGAPTSMPGLAHRSAFAVSSRSTAVSCSRVVGSWRWRMTRWAIWGDTPSRAGFVPSVVRMASRARTRPSASSVTRRARSFPSEPNRRSFRREPVPLGESRSFSSGRSPSWERSGRRNSPTRAFVSASPRRGPGGAERCRTAWTFPRRHREIAGTITDGSSSSLSHRDSSPTNVSSPRSEPRLLDRQHAARAGSRRTPLPLIAFRRFRDECSFRK